VGISWAGAKRLAQTYLPGLDVELVRVDQNDNRFAYTVAINKAQRNAIMNLLDEALIKRALQRDALLEGAGA
jgi:hypothetical protein